MARPTALNEKLRLKIKQFTIEAENSPSLVKLAQNLEIPFKTVQCWYSGNYKGFMEFWDDLKRDWNLMRAENNISELLDINTKIKTVDKNGNLIEYNDPRLIKIKADASFFVANTLGKEYYSKKTNVNIKSEGILASLCIAAGQEE